MTADQLFRWLFVLVLLTSLSISTYYQRKARTSGEAISGAHEATSALLLRSLFAVPLCLSMFTYALKPSWMSWAFVQIPTWCCHLARAGTDIHSYRNLYFISRLCVDATKTNVNHMCLFCFAVQSGIENRVDHQGAITFQPKANVV